MWTEDGDDTCAAAEAAGNAAGRARAPPSPLTLDTSTSFTWDGDGYKVYALTIPPGDPPRALQLKLHEDPDPVPAPIKAPPRRAKRPSAAESKAPTERA